MFIDQSCLNVYFVPKIQYNKYTFFYLSRQKCIIIYFELLMWPGRARYQAAIGATLLYQTWSQRQLRLDIVWRLNQYSTSNLIKT
jgi:hypothetical protein